MNKTWILGSVAAVIVLILGAFFILNLGSEKSDSEIAEGDIESGISGDNLESGGQKVLTEESEGSLTIKEKEAISCGDADYDTIKSIIDSGDCSENEEPIEVSLCVEDEETQGVYIKMSSAKEGCTAYCIINFGESSSAKFLDCGEIENFEAILDSAGSALITSSNPDAVITTTSSGSVTQSTGTVGDAGVSVTQVDMAYYTGNDATCRTCI